MACKDYLTCPSTPQTLRVLRSTPSVLLRDPSTPQTLRVLRSTPSVLLRESREMKVRSSEVDRSYWPALSPIEGWPCRNPSIGLREGRVMKVGSSEVDRSYWPALSPIEGWPCRNPSTPLRKVLETQHLHPYSTAAFSLITFSSVAPSMGLTRCLSNPASSARWRSCSCPQPDRAIMVMPLP